MQTKKQRLTKRQVKHLLYKEALSIYKSNRWNGLCWTLSEAVNRLSGFTVDVDYYELELLFPEWVRQRPVNAGSYWFQWDDDGRKKRMSILKKCIKETSPKQ